MVVCDLCGVGLYYGGLFVVAGFSVYCFMLWFGYLWWFVYCWLIWVILLVSGFDLGLGLGFTVWL